MVSSVRLLWKITVGLSFCAPLLADFTLECRRKFSGETFFPLEIEKQQDRQIRLPGWKLYRLGKGTNGIVANAVKGDQSTVVKGYFDVSARANDWERNTQRDSDILTLTQLSREDCVGKSGFKVPKAKPTKLKLVHRPADGNFDIQGIEFTDTVMGRSVFSILQDATIETDVRDYVREKYKTSLTKLQACLKRKFAGKVNELTLAFYKRLDNPVFKMPFIVMQVDFHPDENTEISNELMIKADGIIVHPKTLDFYLVDAE